MSSVEDVRDALMGLVMDAGEQFKMLHDAAAVWWRVGGLAGQIARQLNDGSAAGTVSDTLGGAQRNLVRANERVIEQATGLYAQAVEQILAYCSGTL